MSTSTQDYDFQSRDQLNDQEGSVSMSRLLKFGVDRILSDEITSSSTTVRQHSISSIFHPYTINKDETCVTQSTPCSGCLSSLFRCCRIHMISDLPVSVTQYHSGFYPSRCSLLHTPKPIRPYTNLILESDLTDRGQTGGPGNVAKRKRSWSRAVFSNLQRKGLEKRFQMQKYITKPDRRQLAATLGLTDAQVKVWFQNRRMKWRHNKELKYHSGFKASDTSESSQMNTDSVQKQLSQGNDVNKVMQQSK